MSRWTKLAVAGAVTAGLLAASASLFAGEWTFFEACGFKLPEGEEEENVAKGYLYTLPAPNVIGYWVKKRQVSAIIKWKNMRGIECHTLFVVGTAHELHVIGSMAEIREKLK